MSIDCLLFNSMPTRFRHGIGYFYVLFGYLVWGLLSGFGEKRFAHNIDIL